MGIWNSEREFLEEKSLKLDKINIDVLKKDSTDSEKKSKEINELKIQLIEIEKSLKKFKGY